MNYSKVDYEFLASSTPVNGTAASVISKPTEYDSGAEAKEEYKNIATVLQQIDSILSDLPKDDDRRKGIVKRKIELVERRKELRKQFPALGLKRRHANSYILDEFKARMSKSEFEACVRAGRKKAEADVLAGRDVEAGQ